MNLKKLPPLIVFITGLASCHAQSPTFRALLQLNHDVNNNKFDLSKGPQKEDFSNKRNIVWQNAYFRYFKNPVVQESQDPDESMKFSLIRQSLFSIYLSSDTTISLKLNKGTKDRIDIDVVVYTMAGDKIDRTKLKGKNYEVEKGKDFVAVKINPGIVPSGSIVNVIVETEGYNFSKLGPFNFAKPVEGNYAYLLSVNIPEPFSYELPNNLKIESDKLEAMTLKQFTYTSTNPIVDYSANSRSIKWSLTSGNVASEMSFKLQGVNMNRNFGISSEKLLKDSK